MQIYSFSPKYASEQTENKRKVTKVEHKSGKNKVHLIGQKG